MNGERVSDPVSVRIPSDIIEALRRAAASHDRPMARQLRHYLREGLARDGFLPSRQR